VQTVLVDQPVAIVVPLGVWPVFIHKPVKVVVDTVDRIFVPEKITVVVDPIHGIFVDEPVTVVVDDHLGGEGATPVELRLEGLSRDEYEAHRVQGPGVLGVADAPRFCVGLHSAHQ
jgi:hypothetical protein